MNYELSVKILAEIKKAKKILLNCHEGPDPDGIGSTLAMKLILEKMGKEVEIICPSKLISKQTNFLKGYSGINLGVDFRRFDFSKYDLLIALDTPNFSLLAGNQTFEIPRILTIVIDHHYVSTLQGDIRLIDKKATSVGEMLFLIFADWETGLDKNVAECLLTSIIGDTGAFAYPNVTTETLTIASQLMDIGADKNLIVDRIYRTEDFRLLKFWSFLLLRMEIDKERKFVWSAIAYDDYKIYESLDEAKSKSASLFAPIVTDTDFGFVAIEEKPKSVSVSFRGRTDFDTSRIAKELGGGGHKLASAAKIEGLAFDQALEKILAAARKYAKKTS